LRVEKRAEEIESERERERTYYLIWHMGGLGVAGGVSLRNMG